MRDFDASEVRRFGRQLRRASAPQLARLAVAMNNTIDEVATQARAIAPKDRPWLSTSEGIRTARATVSPVMRAAVYSPHDPDGANLGLHVEYGTSDTAPQPFLTPPFARRKELFYAEAVKIVNTPL